MSALKRSRLVDGEEGQAAIDIENQSNTRDDEELGEENPKKSQRSRKVSKVVQYTDDDNDEMDNEGEVEEDYIEYHRTVSSDGGF
jgi:hypothetical protein